MGDDRVAAVHNPAVIPPLVEHPDVYAKERCQKHDPFRCPLIRGNKHHMLTVYDQVLILGQHRLRKLQGR